MALILKKNRFFSVNKPTRFERHSQEKINIQCHDAFDKFLIM
jgi:hypothetical protein